MTSHAHAELPEPTYPHIVCTPDVVNGEPRVAGFRIRVRDIVVARDKGGYSPEEIAATVYPDLTLAQVYCALAYAEDHRGELARAIEEEAEFVEEFKRLHPNLVRDVRFARDEAY